MLDLYKTKIIPVVVVDKAQDITPLSDAMLKGGQNVLEITLRTSAGLEAIEIASKNPSLIIGAGTVVNKEQVLQAYKAGAKFIVSPGLSSEVVLKSKELGLEVFPGTVTPSEIMHAIKLGLNTVKFFPANIYGGFNAIKALGGPFPDLKFIPTGGVNIDNINDYLSVPSIVSVGGSWMCPKNLVNEGKFDEIERLTKEAIQKALNN